MMRLCLLYLCVTQSLAALTLTKLSYTRMPYRNIQSPTTSDFAMFQDAAYKAAYHNVDRLLYVASGNGASRYLHIWDMNQPSNPALLYTHTFDTHSEDGKITDVAACPDTIAVSLSHVIPTQEGHVELFKPYNRNTKVLELSGRYTVGSYPKNLEFNSDCTRLVVVNEGPVGMDGNNNFVDPEGSLNIFVRNDNGFPIDIPMNFMQFNGRYEEYLAKGVRYVYRGDHSANPPIVNTFSQDLEPEAVTISNDDRYAFISLMENNAMAKIDLINLNIVDIYPLGVKNWTSYDIDASDSNRAYFPGRYNIYSFYQPGALSFGVVNGAGFVISADTGAPKTLTTAANGVAFSDNARGRSARSREKQDLQKTIKERLLPCEEKQTQVISGTNGESASFVSSIRQNVSNGYLEGGLIDSTLVSSELYTALGNDQALGRAYMSTLEKSCVYDLVDDIYLFGGRGFSLWDSNTMNHVFESGEDLERRGAEAYPSTFNGECFTTRNTPTQDIDQRSDDMGPEPNSLAVGTISNEPVLFVGTRTGLVYTYAMRGVSATFQSVYRDGQTSDTWGNLYNNDNSGNALISDMGFISANDSSTKTPLLYVISRGSGSLGVYEVSGTVQ